VMAAAQLARSNPFAIKISMILQSVFVEMVLGTTQIYKQMKLAMTITLNTTMDALPLARLKLDGTADRPLDQLVLAKRKSVETISLSLLKSATMEIHLTTTVVLLTAQLRKLGGFVQEEPSQQLIHALRYVMTI